MSDKINRQPRRSAWRCRHDYYLRILERLPDAGKSSSMPARPDPDF